MNIYMKKYVEAAHALRNAQKLRESEKKKLHEMYIGSKLTHELRLLDKTVELAQINFVSATHALKKAVQNVVDAAAPRLFIGDSREALDMLRYDLCKFTSSELLALAEANKGNMYFLRSAHEYAKNRNMDPSVTGKILAMKEELFLDSRFASEMLRNLTSMFSHPESIGGYEKEGIIASYDDALTKLLKAYPTVEHTEAIKAEEAELAEEQKKIEQEVEALQEQKKQFDKVEKAYKEQQEKLEKMASGLEEKQKKLSDASDALNESKYQVERVL